MLYNYSAFIFLFLTLKTTCSVYQARFQYTSQNPSWLFQCCKGKGFPEVKWQINFKSPPQFHLTKLVEYNLVLNWGEYEKIVTLNLKEFTYGNAIFF